jgi:preprotein translocase subunit SecA
MRLFGSDRLIGMMNTLGLEEGQVIEHPWVTKSIEIAQRRVEQHNFEIRKQILEYDNVMNKQREVIYGQRREILEGVSLKEYIAEILDKILDGILATHASAGRQIDSMGLVSVLRLRFGLELDSTEIQNLGWDELKENIYHRIIGAYDAKEQAISSDLLRHLERLVFLQIIDNKWKDHLYAMDNLREGIGLRAYGQRDPLIEYKRESFQMFSEMMNSIEEEAVDIIFKLEPAKPGRFRGAFSAVSQQLRHPEMQTFSAPTVMSGDSDQVPAEPLRGNIPQTSSHAKVGRNDPCPCGKINPRTGKPLKYKKCCYPKYN